MPVKRRKPKGRRPDIPLWQVNYLLHGIEPDDDTNPFDALSFCTTDGREARDLWHAMRDDLLADWIAEHPGTRPFAWWQWDAPREPVGTHPGTYYDGQLPELRQRIGGTGDPLHEHTSIFPSSAFGVPDQWLTASNVELYSDDGTGCAVDADDPPRYESEAAYLDRHGLLLPAEKKRLTKADYQPEKINPEEKP